MAAAYSVPVAQVTYRWARPLAVVLLVTSAAGITVAWLLAPGNTPYTPVLTATDHLVGVVMFSVPVLGFAVLAARPLHPSGWLLLASGAAFAGYLLCHEVAVRLLLVSAGPHSIGVFTVWVATWLLVPGLGMLPFALALWPNGVIETPRLRVIGRVATAALVLASVAQAVAPDHLDGVAPSHRLANPAGVSALAGSVTAITVSAVAVLFVFTLSAVIDMVLRTARSRGERRRRLMPVTVAVVTLPLLALAAVTSGEFGVAWLAIPGGGIGLVLAAYGIRRSERAEQARTVLVRQREDERLRLRRDLHDGIGPLLAALRLELGRTVEAGQMSRALLDDAIAEVRRIARDLRPAALDELGLRGALQQQALTLGGPSGPAVDLMMPDHSPMLAAAVEVNLLRISGEALTNAVRHAGASHCQLELVIDDDVRLRISDDGAGTRAAPEGVGIQSMRARATELGGHLEVRPRAGGGTVVEAVLPLPKGSS